MEEERRVVCTVKRLFTNKVGGMEEGEKGRRIQGCSQIYEGGMGGRICASEYTILNADKLYY